MESGKKRENSSDSSVNIDKKEESNKSFKCLKSERSLKKQSIKQSLMYKGKRVSEKYRKNKVIGTADYIAPEVLLGEDHTYRLDFWSLGVIVYEFLTGALPFNDEAPEIIFAKILKRDISYPPIGYEEG
jgi:serine/threonine protein kinase